MSMVETSHLLSPTSENRQKNRHDNSSFWVCKKLPADLSQNSKAPNFAYQNRPSSLNVCANPAPKDPSTVE